MYSFDEFRAAMLRRIATIVHVDTVHSTDSVRDLQIDDLYLTNILMSAECLLMCDIPETAVVEMTKELLDKEKTVQDILDAIWKRREVSA